MKIYIGLRLGTANGKQAFFLPTRLWGLIHGSGVSYMNPVRQKQV